ncbi:hypothetical protein KHA80_21340 [Anaerobacillus sp. HL2]|nr:hypothetical protein KHA80_21340 [Anaerobacillus sp. HL2]
MTTLLLILVALKGICLFFCWRSMSIIMKNKEKHIDISDAEVQELENKLTKLVKQNEQLSTELQSLKKFDAKQRF